MSNGIVMNVIILSGACVEKTSIYRSGKAIRRLWNFSAAVDANLRFNVRLLEIGVHERNGKGTTPHVK